MHKKTLSILTYCLIFCFSPANSSTFHNEDLLEIKGRSLFVPNKLGDIHVQHNNNGFHVISDEKISPIHHYNVDKSLRDLTNKDLISFLSVGNLIVGASYSTEENEIEYTLRGYVRGLGGMDPSPEKNKDDHPCVKYMLTGSASGAGLGAAIGTIAGPIIGTTIGSYVGGAIGGAVGMGTCYFVMKDFDEATKGSKK